MKFQIWGIQACVVYVAKTKALISCTVICCSLLGEKSSGLQAKLNTSRPCL